MLSKFFTLLLLSHLSHSFDYWQQGKDWNGTCQTGKKQSPINFKDSDLVIIDEQEPDLQVYVNLDDEFEDFFITDEEKGTIALSRDFGKLTMDDLDYKIINMHLHSPSEHQVNGDNYDLEIHLVGQSKNGNLHVIGIFFEIGKEENEFINGVMERLDTGKTTKFDSSWLLIDGKQDDYYYYDGSVTGPIVNNDCVEGVRWTVMRNPVTISKEQFEFFDDRWANNQSFAGGNGNNRPVQKINNRKVYLHSASESWSVWISVGMIAGLIF
jgi:carbonic anhydrase